MPNTLGSILRRRAATPFLGVHDTITAKLAEREGFEALWLSGFGLSTVHGVRDANELSWDEVLRAIDSIAHSVSIPLLVDADTGFGDYNTARMFARRAHKFGAAGLCFEDKQFPKLNSFAGEGQKLAPASEFCGKIRAVRDSTGDSLYLVARTEALIVGAPMEEALSRAESYVEAGADAILIHSKRPDFAEIETFMQQWRAPAPVVIVPTTYDMVPPQVYADCGIAGVIWANQALRASIQMTINVCQSIRQNKSPIDIRLALASMSDIFALVGNDELIAAAKKYAC